MLPDIQVILHAVSVELYSAFDQHGSMKSQHEAYAVILEEVDEFWDEVKLNPAKLTLEQREARLKAMRKELVQVAAMAIRAIIDLKLEAPDVK